MMKMYRILEYEGTEKQLAHLDLNHLVTGTIVLPGGITLRATTVPRTEQALIGVLKDILSKEKDSRGPFSHQKDGIKRDALGFTTEELCS